MDTVKFKFAMFATTIMFEENCFGFVAICSAVSQDLNHSLQPNLKEITVML